MAIKLLRLTDHFTSAAFHRKLHSILSRIIINFYSPYFSWPLRSLNFKFFPNHFLVDILFPSTCNLFYFPYRISCFHFNYLVYSKTLQEHANHTVVIASSRVYTKRKSCSFPWDCTCYIYMYVHGLI